MSTEKIIVGMSGGVDSSVCALLLKERGYRVEGLFMKNWDERRPDGGCLWQQDVEDAMSVCEKLSIPINTVDLSDAYWRQVFSHFLEDCKNGMTPNPDVLCNQKIKFSAFLEHTARLGATKIATGHYARLEDEGGQILLRKGRDLNKDQSYFLCRLNQRQLRGSLFPLGAMEKHKVRRLARRAGLPVHNKKDSTGICFVGERRFREFLGRYLPAQPGAIEDHRGCVVGQHQGIFYYTLGQRRGLGIGGRRDADGAPWYVYAKDVERNVLRVVQGRDHPLLYSRRLIAAELNWIGGAPDTPHHCAAKTRYRQADQDCVLERLDEDSYSVNFSRAQRSVTPGQFVVFYDGDICLGGGVIVAAA